MGLPCFSATTGLGLVTRVAHFIAIIALLIEQLQSELLSQHLACFCDEVEPSEALPHCARREAIAIRSPLEREAIAKSFLFFWSYLLYSQ